MSNGYAAHLNPKLWSKKFEAEPTRNGYGQGLVALGKSNPKVVVLCADLTESTRSQDFANAYPNRFLEVGVAEQNMAGVAAGLALAGKIPFIASYAVFSPGRNWDQLRVSVCYSQANVKIAGAHAGISVGPDGATHQALEDIAIMRVLPNMTVVVPCDVNESRKATIAAAALNGPVYLRFAREKTPVITTPKSPFAIGKAQILREGRDVALMAAGPVLYEALMASKMLASVGISATVINSHTIKPLDERTIVAAAKRCGAVITVEEHQVTGGLGGAVAECLARQQPVPMAFIGMPDRFGESGEPNELLEKFGLTADAITIAAKKLVKRKA